MGRTRILGFNPDRMRKQMLSIAVEEQNKRLVDFAKEQINVIGEAIQQHNSRNHMDATGNLLDSLCWGVLYNGKYVDNGFYREKTATESAYMHQWWQGGFVTKWKEGKSLGWDRANWEDLPEIQGHEMADRFMSRQEGKGEGWKVFFAILAPYWGYWEKGFNMKSRRGSQNYIQFSVMTQFYDHVKPELKPMRVSFRVTQAIRYTQTSLMKSAKRGVYSGRRRFM